MQDICVTATRDHNVYASFRPSIATKDAETHSKMNTVGDMYDTYTSPLQPCTHLTLKLLIQGHPRSAEVTHIADFKSAYISLIIGPRGLQCEANL